MDALRFLRVQHDQMRELFAQYEGADRGRKRRLFLQLADLLALHNSLEERRFYPAVFVGPLRKRLMEAVEEHLSAKRILADLLDMDVGQPGFDAKMRVLRTTVTHHLREEEVSVFPEVRARFSGAELDRLGTELAELGQLLMEEEPRSNIPREVDRAAPLQ